MPKVYKLSDGREIEFSDSATTPQIRAYLVNHFPQNISPEIVQAHNRDTSRQALNNNAEQESRLSSRTGGLQGGEDIARDTSTEMGGIGRHALQMITPSWQGVGETAILGPAKTTLDLGRGLVTGGRELGRELGAGENARAAVTGLSLVNPLASGPVANVNELENQGRDKEARGAGALDSALLASGLRFGNAPKVAGNPVETPSLAYRAGRGAGNIYRSLGQQAPEPIFPSRMVGPEQGYNSPIGPQQYYAEPIGPVEFSRRPGAGNNAAEMEPEHFNQHEPEVPNRLPPISTSLEEGEASTSPQHEGLSELSQETIPQLVRFRGAGGRIGKRVENVSPTEPLERFEKPVIQSNQAMAGAFRRRAALPDMEGRGERYGLTNAAGAIEGLEKPYSDYGEGLTARKFIGPRTMERIGNYNRSIIPGDFRGAVPQSTLKFIEDFRSGNLPSHPELEQGGHAGSGVVSEEEISRPGKNYVISKGGNLTYHGKQFAPESIGANQSHVTVLPNGEFRVNAGPELTEGQKIALRRAQE